MLEPQVFLDEFWRHEKLSALGYCAAELIFILLSDLRFEEVLKFSFHLPSRSVNVCQRRDKALLKFRIQIRKPRNYIAKVRQWVRAEAVRLRTFFCRCLVISSSLRAEVRLVATHSPHLLLGIELFAAVETKEMHAS